MHSLFLTNLYIFKWIFSASSKCLPPIFFCVPLSFKRELFRTVTDYKSKEHLRTFSILLVLLLVFVQYFCQYSFPINLYEEIHRRPYVSGAEQNYKLKLATLHLRPYSTVFSPNLRPPASSCFSAEIKWISVRIYHWYYCIIGYFLHINFPIETSSTILLCY